MQNCAWNGQNNKSILWEKKDDYMVKRNVMKTLYNIMFGNEFISISLINVRKMSTVVPAVQIK